MTRLVKVERDPALSMRLRHGLLNLPSEMFRQYFNGRVPTLWEKAICIERSLQSMAAIEVYENDLYHVDVNYTPPFVHLAIRRHDGFPCKDWPHFQMIKNQIVGPENEAMELFPAESRLVDSSEQYHLWVHTDPSFRFPLGFRDRYVLSDSASRALLNGGRERSRA